MKTRPFKKLWHGYASLRDYEAMEGVQAGGLILVFEGKKMTLTAAQLMSMNFQLHGKRSESKIPNWKNPIDGSHSYAFIDFKFVPDGVAERQLQMAF
jgi:hypothetical protein